MSPPPSPRLPRFGLLLCILVLGTPSAFAQSDWETAPRTADFEAQGDAFYYTASQAVAGGENRIEADFALGEARLHAGLLSTEPDAQAHIAIDTTFVALVEFVDLGHDGALSAGDPVVQREELAGIAGANLDTRTVPPMGYEATATYPLRAPSDAPLGFDAPPGFLELRFELAPQRQPGLDGPLAPNQVRYHVRIADFPFQRNDTSLALETLMAATGQPRSISSGFAADAHPFEVAHRWPPEALVDGSRRPAHVTLVQDGQGPRETSAAATRVAYFVVPPGADVRFSPEASVTRAQLVPIGPTGPQLLGDGAVYLLAVVSCVLVVGAATAARLRRR